MDWCEREDGQGGRDRGRDEDAWRAQDDLTQEQRALLLQIAIDVVLTEEVERLDYSSDGLEALELCLQLAG